MASNRALRRDGRRHRRPRCPHRRAVASGAAIFGATVLRRRACCARPALANGRCPNHGGRPHHLCLTPAAARIPPARPCRAARHARDRCRRRRARGARSLPRAARPAPGLAPIRAPRRRRRASRACIVVITGAPATRKGTATKRGVVKAIWRECPSLARASSTAALPLAQARRHVRQPHVVLEGDRRAHSDFSALNMHR